MKVLFLHPNHQDYLSDSLFHGLRSVLGEACVDAPRYDCMYSPLTDAMRSKLRGNSFTLYGMLVDLAYFLSLILAENNIIMTTQSLIGEQPLVSIIIPTFERLHYLPYAIKSALAQTYQNIEVIVSDDGSTSDVRSLVATFTDKRIRYRRNDVNIGQVLNNLAAFREAKGKYVANLHDDDIWEPTFLEKLIPPLEADETVVLAFSNHFIMDCDGNIDDQVTEQNEAFYMRDILTPGLHRPFCRIGLVDLSIPLAMASVYRKDAIDWDDFPTEVNSFYDRWLIYLACRTGMGAYFHKDRLTRYRVHAISATSTSGVDFPRSSIACHNRFLQDERLKPLWPALKELRDLSYTRMGICQLEEGSVKEARHSLILSIKNKPNLRAIVALCLSFLPADILKAIIRRYRDR